MFPVVEKVRPSSWPAWWAALCSHGLSDRELELIGTEKAPDLFAVGLGGDALGSGYVLGVGALRVPVGVLEDALVVVEVVGWLR